MAPWQAAPAREIRRSPLSYRGVSLSKRWESRVLAGGTSFSDGEWGNVGLPKAQLPGLLDRLIYRFLTKLRFYMNPQVRS